MSLFDLIRAVRQHVVVVALMLIATGFAAYGVYSQVPVYYQSDASMVVLLPNRELLEDKSVVPVNPWASLGAQSAQVAASAIASIASSDAFNSTLADAGVSSDVTVEVAPLYGGGVVLTLSAVSKTPINAQEDLSTVSAQVSEALRQKQLDVEAPPETLLTVTDLTEATAPAPLATSGIKLAGVTVLVGLVITGCMVLLLETLRLKARRSVPGDTSAPAGNRPVSDESVTTEDEWLEADLWAQSKPLVTHSN